MRRALASLFHIREGEGRLVWLCLLFSFCIGLARTFAGAVARPLFLVVFGADGLPYLYVASAVAVALGGYLYGRLEQRAPMSRLVLATLALLAGTLALFRLGLDGGAAPWLVLTLSIWLELMWVLTSLAFWGPAARLFNVRQGKRLFGLIGSGELVAIVAAGLATPALVDRIGTHNLLWVAVAGLAGAWGFYAWIAAAFRQELAIQSPGDPLAGPRPGPPPAYRELLGQRYVLLMFGFSILSLLGFYVLDAVFYDLAAMRYPAEDDLASFVGLFLAGSGLLSLAARAFVSGPAITRFGLLFGLLAMPALNGLGAGAVAAAGSLFGLSALVFWLATATKVADKIVTQSITQTSFQILYQPLPIEQRLRVQTAIEGIVEPLAAGLAGLLLLALGRLAGFGAVQLAYVLVAVLAGLAAVTLFLNARYPGALMQAMDRRRLGGVSLSLADSSSVAVLQRGLRNPHAGVVLASLNMLEEIEHESLPAFLRELVTHPAPEVRQEALVRLERLGAAQALDVVRARVAAEEVPAVRGAALRTLAALGESELFEEVSPYLDDPEPALRVGAMVGLLRSGGIEGVLAAGERLLELLHGAAPADRALAAQVLADVGISSFSRPLAGLLRDP
ncbi:MAG TPA: HEAT repeat domain-containing protein, partial [Herpetosiphonaceae bacterium]